MEWNLEYGKFLGKYEQIYEKTGKKPSALAKRPKVCPDLLQYWIGFVHLDRSREWNYGGSPIGIRFTEVSAYAQIQRFDSEDTVDFAHYVNLLDGVYLKWAADHGKT